MICIFANIRSLLLRCCFKAADFTVRLVGSFYTPTVCCDIIAVFYHLDILYTSSALFTASTRLSNAGENTICITLLSATNSVGFEPTGGYLQLRTCSYELSSARFFSLVVHSIVGVEPTLSTAAYAGTRTRLPFLKLLVCERRANTQLRVLCTILMGSRDCSASR